jgi:hypothetical protein
MVNSNHHDQSEPEGSRALNAALGLQADREPAEGETPDFMVAVSGRTIGVEITMYRSRRHRPPSGRKRVGAV